VGLRKEVTVIVYVNGSVVEIGVPVVDLADVPLRVPWVLYVIDTVLLLDGVNTGEAESVIGLAVAILFVAE
jgi:hypothetical protein